MTKVESMTADDEPGPERLQQSHDFSSLQGLQVAGDGPWTRVDGEEGSLEREALTLELGARAARFHQAVDASIVLANDGIVRWLGDPIAKLAPGPDLLTPSALILADSRLPDDARQMVATRVELWLAALTRRLLGPLFSLRDLHDGSESVRDLAAKVANALGVLERDLVRNQVKAFDQNSRAALRKHGVRFGAYYIYVPTVLKPAARALALQLWGLQAQGVDPDALTQSLAPMASSGRTSLPIDQHIARDGYRVSGFRPCGDRVVRVDIVERLADMIRAAFIQPGAASGPHGPNGFVVNGQMTSLTGCSGEAFSSILRSLGFESTVINRSALPAAQAAEATPSSENVLATTAPEEPSRPETAPVEAETETVSEPSADLPVAPQTEDGIPPPEVVHASDETECVADVQVPGAPSSTEPVSASNALGADDRPMAAVSEETVILWRPVRRPRSPKVSPPHGQRTRAGSAAPQAPVGPPATDGAGSEAPVSPREHRPEKRRRWQPQAVNQEKGARSSPGPARSEGPRPDEDRRQSSGNRDMPRPKSGPATQPVAVTVDPNSPFAKLLELRTLLESQAKNRR